VTVRALVLRTAGTNCDRETTLALERAGAVAERVHVHRLLAEPARLEDADIVVIAGGFSYGDDVAAGRIFGLDVRMHLAEALPAFVERGGLVLGVCNGFQVLVDTGLLEPGRARGERSVALTGNDPDRYQCRWVTLRAEECACPWLEPGDLLPCPVAHGEGRVALTDDETLARLSAAGQIALRYVDGAGRPTQAYPENPNGSVGAIAGLCDPSGRALGLMPHPERNIHPWQHPAWTRLGPRSEGEGLRFYRRMVEVARAGAPGPAR